MRRGFFLFWRIILYPTHLHIVCAAAAFACCIPVIFPEICPASHRSDVISYSGSGILLAQSISTAFVVIAMMSHMFRLSNTRAYIEEMLRLNA